MEITSLPAADAAPRSSLLRSGSALSLMTLVSRVLGLLREMTKAALLGTSALSDAFSVAFMIPNLFRRLFAEGSIAAAFIPTLKEYLLKNKTGETVMGQSKSRYDEQTVEFISCMFTFLTFFVSLAVVLGVLLCPLIVPLFSMKAFDETILLTRIMFPFLAFISIAALFQGILNSVHVFTPSGLAPILLNLVTIACAYGLSPFTKNPARAMAVGIIIGGFLEAAIQFPFVWRKGFRFFFTGLGRAVKNPGTRTVLRLIGPTIIGMAAYQLNDLVSTALAGYAGEGVVSSLQYSLRLQELILGVFAVSIGTVLLPDLAEHAKTNRWENYNQRLSQAMDIIALITIPITFFFLAQGETLIRLLFQTRSFNEESVALTYGAFVFHMPGLFFIALNRILAPAFYAQSDSRSPTLAGILSFAVNITLAAVLVRPMRGSGVALALTIASAANTGLLLVFLGRNPRIAVSKALGPAILYAVKLIAFSAFAAVPVFLLGPRFNTFCANLGTGRLIRHGLPLAVEGLGFAAIGIALLLISGDKQIKALRGIFRRKKSG
ncbi:putative lipid II flippase MurJ [Spirochaetia bacterium]|nr:putative lipid II flippase MurJ [Spirochaetia bacterium]